MKTFQSTPITFIDQTDSRKLEVYIKSNLPTVQIYNASTGAHTPDWRLGEGLILTTDVYLDSRVMTDTEYSTTSVKWYKDEISTDTEIQVTTPRTLRISTNELASNPIITYICEAKYQGITASTRMTFVQVKNGEKGADGTSVKILGTADSVTLVPDTDYYTLVYSKGSVTAAAIGDSYVYQGNLYVCSVLDGSGTNDYFVNVGEIQGPKGEDAKSLVLSGNSQTFKINKANVISPSTITVVAQVSNTSVTGWSYSTNGGQTFVSTTPAGVVRNGDIVTVTGTTLTSNSIVIKATDGNIEDVFTVYKVLDGSDGEKGDSAPIVFLTNENVSFNADENGKIPLTTFTTNVVGYIGDQKVLPTIGTVSGMPTGMTVSSPIESSNELILTFSIANGSDFGSSWSQSNHITIPVTYPASTNLILNWSKVNAGRSGVGIKSTTIAYGESDSASIRPADDKWQSTIPVVADGKYLWTRTVIDYTDETDTVTYTYAKQGVKGDAGTSGSSVTVSSIQYQEGASATVAPTGTWSNAVVSVADGKYLWSKTTFSDNKIAYGVAKQGSTGRGISEVTEHYLATTASSGVAVSTSGWTEAIQTIDSSKRYLWNYETITYTDGTTNSTTPIIIGVFGSTGATGATGKGIKSIKEYYLASASSSGVTTATSGWKDTMQSITSTNKYLWNYELITYTDDSTETIPPVIIGVYGDKGDQGNPGADAYTVLLTNESHVFAGTTSAAVASSTTTQVLAYKGTAAQSVTIVSVNGVAAKTASTATGIAGLSFACSALSGTSPTITFTCTTAFVSASGTIPIVLSVGGVSITKMFTYSIAFKGATGGTGAASSSYWLVSNASTVQKTASGDVLFTPATLTFTGKIKTGSGAPTDYACRWILAYSTDGSTYTDSYTSTTNETTASIAASGTYKSVRARMYLAGGTTTLLDEQIVPFVSDGETGAIGAPGDPGVTFQVYSNNGYALSTAIPTILLQTFAYLGDVEITAGATFQWYRHNGTDWVAVSGATNAYFNVSRDDVSFSNNYQCKMQFNGTEYVGVVTIEDKNDENKVFASKPSNYFAGDLWIVGTDYAPSGYAVGTMLRAEHTNTTYTDSDWVPATKYDEEIEELKATVDSYKQYFSVNSTNGLQIGNSSINNDILTTDTVNAATVNADSATFESLDVVGRYSGSTMLQAPVINLGNFSLVIESNGSLSIVANT